MPLLRRVCQHNLGGKGTQPPKVARAPCCPWIRLNPKLLYVDELEFVFYLLFIDVTEERQVVPFDFLYEAELDDSCTVTRLSTLLFQRSCPLPWSPLVRASLVPGSWLAACAFVCLVLRHCRVTQKQFSFILA